MFGEKFINTVPLKSVLPLLTRFNMKSAEIITERISKEIFSFFDMKAIQEIFNELNDIRIIEIIKKVLYINSYSVPLKSKFDIEDNAMNTDIVIKYVFFLRYCL